jgi:hypothetical protein
MDGPTLAFHMTLTRLLKGCITAYEKWWKTRAREAGLDPNKAPPITMAEFVERSLPNGVRTPELVKGLAEAATVAGLSPSTLPQDITRRQ